MRAFRIWQKYLLDQYLDLLSSRMRQTKKSIHNKRFLFISKKAQFKLRRAFKQWGLKAKSPSLQFKGMFDGQDYQLKQLIAGLKAANYHLMKRKLVMTIATPCRSLKTAFYHWKLTSAYESQGRIRDTNLSRARIVSLNFLSSLVHKNLSIIKKSTFWELKRFSD